MGWGTSVPGWLGIWGSGTPCGEKRKAGSPGGTGSRREERGEPREGPGAGKGSPRGLPGMGGAASLSAPRALVLWAALGAAGKAWGRGRSPEGRGGAGRGCQGEGFRRLSPQLTSDPHLTPRTGGATRRISRETSCQVQPGRGPSSPSWDPGPSPSWESQPLPSSPRSPAQPLNPGGSPWDIIHAHFK